MELRDGPVTLRPFTEVDVPWIHAACQDPEIQHWLPHLPRPYTEDDARAFVAGRVELAPHSFAVLEEGEPVGSVGFRVDHNLTGTFGYWCVPGARGRGVITRGLRQACGYGLGELALGRLELTIDVENFASQRVAEKVGFQREGVLRSQALYPDGSRRDNLLLSLLPGELNE